MSSIETDRSYQIPLKFPDLSRMNRLELKDHFKHEGVSPQYAEILAIREIQGRITEQNAEYAKDLGLSKEQFHQLFERYGYETAPKIIHLLQEGKATTVEEAYAMAVPHIHNLDTAEKNIDAVGKAIQTKPLYQRHTKGGRILEAMDRHEAEKGKHHIGKRIVQKMYERLRVSK